MREIAVRQDAADLTSRVDEQGVYELDKRVGVSHVMVRRISISVCLVSCIVRYRVCPDMTFIIKHTEQYFSSSGAISKVLFS